MRVLLLNQYYHPDVAATAQLAADLGEALASRGHQVTAIASRRYYAPEHNHGGALAAREDHRGVKIVRVPATALGRASNLGRALDYGSFFAAAAAPLLGLARPDVVIALSTPPLIAALGLLARELRRSRLVFWVMDVYPEVALRLGALDATGAATRALERMTRLVLSRADAVVALDEAMGEHLEAAGCAAGKIEVIDNWVDGEAIHPRPRDGHPLRRALGLGDDFTVSYSGNLGRGHDFDTLLGAMALLVDRRIQWLVIGDGPRRAEVESAVRERGLPRVTFLPYQPREELPLSLTCADAQLITLADGLAGLLVPSKLYGALAAGAPVLYVGPPAGRVFRAVTEGGVGLAVRNGDAAGLARAVATLADHPAERAAFAARARALHDACYRREQSLEKHHALLTRVHGGGACC